MKKQTFVPKKLVKVGKAIDLTKGGVGKIIEYFIGGGIGRYG
ncbi:acinetodin/klebsidin/J25 family lasso peptide [Salmonella enterica]|nr:acinetodin/klebsidin/J25 family lasso peptide [Salmonella enterica]